MRTINFIIAISLLLWLTACSEQEREIVDQEPTTSGSARILKLRVSMPDEGTNNGSTSTRLQMTETDAGDIAVGWKTGDKINLCFVGENGNTIKTVADIPVTNISANGKKADFEITIPDGITGTFDLYGVYGATFSSANSTTVLLPTAPVGTALSDNEAVSVMRFAATGLTQESSPQVTFSHIGSIFGVWIYNDTDTPVSVGQITISSSASGFNWLKNSSGQAKFDVVTNSFPDAKAGTELVYPSQGTMIASHASLKLYRWVVPGDPIAPSDSKFLEIKDINGSGYIERIPARTMSTGTYYRIKMVWDGSHFTYIKTPSDDDHLVGYWPFDGNANDVKGANNGTLYGDVTLTADRKGNQNSAYHFDGSGDYIRCVSPGVLGTTARTISFWAKVHNLSNGLFQTIVVYGGTPTDDGARFEVFLMSGQLVCDISSGRLGKKSAAIIDDVWNFYTVVFSGGSSKSLLNDVQYYVNGVLITENGIQYNPGQVINTNNKNPIYFGSFYGSQNWVGGTIDEVRMYDRALTAAEVKGLYYKDTPF